MLWFRRVASTVAAAWLIACSAGEVRSACLHSFEFIDLGSPLGDLNQDGLITVVDIQCVIITALWELADPVDPAPACLPASSAAADLQCDGTVTVADVALIVSLALGQPLDATLDADGDGCPDTCALPTVRHAFATSLQGASTGGDYHLRPAPVTTALSGTSSGGGYVLGTRTFDRVAPSEEE